MNPHDNVIFICLNFAPQQRILFCAMTMQPSKIHWDNKSPNGIAHPLVLAKESELVDCNKGPSLRP